MRLALSALLLVLFAGGCSQPPLTGLAAELSGSSWTLERVVAPDGAVLRGDDDRVTFAADGTLTISSCNSCAGRYRVRDGVLEVEPGLACTKRACPDGRVELERYFAGPTTLRRDGQYLVVQPSTVEGADAPEPQILLVPAR